MVTYAEAICDCMISTYGCNVCLHYSNGLQCRDPYKEMTYGPSKWPDKQVRSESQFQLWGSLIPFSNGHFKPPG